MLSRRIRKLRPLWVLLLFVVVGGYGVSAWHATRLEIEHELILRSQQRANQEATLLEHWSSALRAFGLSLVLDNDTRVSQVDTRIVLFQSTYPDTVLPVFVVQAQDGIVLGASPIMGASQRPYLQRARQICSGNPGSGMSLASPMALPKDISQAIVGALPACVRVRDASGDPILDIFALLPWPSGNLVGSRAAHPIAGQMPTLSLIWFDPAGKSRTSDRAGSSTANQAQSLLRTHADSGFRMSHGSMVAWTRVSHYPLIITANLPTRAIWYDWLLHGGAGEGFILAILLAAGMSASTWRATRLANQESQLRRYYGVLKEINQALVSTPESTRLYRIVCEHMVDGGQLPLAWIGTVQGTQVQVHAVIGSACGYVDGIEINLVDGDPSGRGPVGDALRDMKTVVIPNLQHDDSFSFWRGRAARYGLRSVVVTPFTTRREERGVLAAYSEQIGFFTPVLIQLMEELARSVALGLNQYDRVQEVTRLSQQDSLTELPNRAYFMRVLDQALGRADRAERLTAIGILDLDYFKQINDTLGHLVGDQVLKHIATHLNQAIRQGDTVARLGGDEFGILLEGVSGISELELIANRLLTAVRTPLQIEGLGHELQSDASLGLTLYPLDEGTPAYLLRHADAALYAVKGAGRHHWQLFHREMSSLAKREYEIHRRLSTALADDELCLYFQPQVDLATGKVLGAEALIRWQDPANGLLNPDSFMSVIEADIRLACLLGRFVLKTAAMAITRWRANNLAFGRLGVNICARHLQHSAFLDDLDAVLTRYPHAASCLTLELTETYALTDLDKSARILAEVRARGLRVALDDFGSGYASLQYVRELPLDVIKLDLQFVQNLEHDTEAFAVGYAALTLAEIQGAAVVAEGVESVRIAHLWRRLGGQAIQGYLVAQPMPESDWITWLSAYVPDRCFASIPRWRPALGTLGLLRTLPHHNQLMRTLREALAVGMPAPETIIELSAAWHAPDPLTNWLASKQATEFDTTALRQAHSALHQMVVDILDGLSEPQSDNALSTIDSADELCEHFIEAVDGVILQVDSQLQAELT